MSSNRYRTVVKRRHVRHREVQALVVIVLAALVLGLGFYLGQRAAYSGMDINPELYRELKVAVPVAEQQIERLEHDLDIARARNEVDKAALEMVRQEIAAQKGLSLELGESLGFYQSLMSPEDVARGLSLKPIELMATEFEDRFVFRIVVLQAARKHTLLKGSLSVEVLGVMDDQPLSFPLAELSGEIEGEDVALRFRYFQAIEGVLILPQGFQPSSVTMVARASVPTKVEITEHYPWAVQKRFSYVGK
jgi:hypothetical protein